MTWAGHGAAGLVLSLTVVLGTGCRDGAPPAPAPERPASPASGPAGPGPSRSTPTGAGVAAAPPAAPTLAPAPRLGLRANHLRLQPWARGPVVLVGGEGLRKHDLEYRSPWSEARVRAGRPARVVRGRKATLTVPWPGGEAEVAITSHGAGTITVRIDGRVAGRIASSARWATGVVAVGSLPAGDHAITLELGGRDVALASLELAPVGAPPSCADDAAPSTTAVGDDVGGWPRLTLATEVPAGAHLVVTPTQGAPSSAPATVASIRVRDQAGVVSTLWSGSPAGQPLVVSLGRFADQLIELELHGDCATRWRDGAIALEAATPNPVPRVDSVVLVVVDTLRSDRVAAVTPGTRVVMPWLTATAAARGLVFAHNQAVAPSSPPSHASIHSGQLPRVHGVVGDTAGPAPGTPLLAAITGAAGLYTGYAGNNDFAMGRLRKASGWRQVFAPIFDGKGDGCRPVIERTLELVRAAAGRRFFVTSLPIDPHVPYDHHPGITERYFDGPFERPLGKRVTSAHLGRIRSLGMTPTRWDQLRGLYDGEVEFLDGCLAALGDGLSALGVADRTAIVLTSDHGEGMGERGGRVGHAYSLHRELVDVPLVWLVPGAAPRRLDLVSSNADLAPTVLALLGLPADARMQGRDLLAMVERGGPAWPRVVASEYGRSYALRARGFHLVVDYGGRRGLYDVAADPEEAHDRSAQAPLPARYLRELAGVFLAHRVAWRGSWGDLGAIAAGSPLAATE